ncbi:Phosphatidylglycerol/phosphatidylinositol transfer protein [Spathaspora passalidarum NRRL Y-27907]|uniref:Phosphatidylglycerol/phosphatidylinositol transfer protein n=1 Tax=Spathaspora passalidarum (strain NRRL Y-27907 / 11-Y1) TaxID=619300 RepID=G3AIS5_SPAPN|nr:Phosphatidylglycerol/phosphatidylinositol transfer protein [Spathaspora passalidarum NRRL Y-27907]EGW34491.1 Phosphatidylglycerol/phosphatidylinositol transfer protein [Spathaspora passalidarum NRRL Y-27907]
MVSFKHLALLTLVGSANCLSVHATTGYFNQAAQLFKSNPDQSVLNLPPPHHDTEPIPGDSPLEKCDITEVQLLTLEEINLLPNPPKAGANLTFTATGFVGKTIEPGAYVDVDVRYGFIKLIHQTFDLCDEVEKVDLQCPINKGNQVISKIVAIPEEVPPGRYFVTARAYTKDDEYITCLSAVIDFPVVRN